MCIDVVCKLVVNCNNILRNEKKLNESYERELEKIKKKKEELPSKISNAKKKFDEIKKQIIS